MNSNRFFWQNAFCFGMYAVAAEPILPKFFTRTVEFYSVQGWSTIIYPLKNQSLLIKLENESLYGIFDSVLRSNGRFRSGRLWPIFDFGPPLPV